MEPLLCLFCSRANPGDANFCNECGTPLNLKPCRQCDAVNARSAERCYRCEAPLPTDAVQAASETSADRLATAALRDEARSESLQEQPREATPFAASARMLAEPVAAAMPQRDETMFDTPVVARAFGVATSPASVGPMRTAEPAIESPAARIDVAGREPEQRGPAANEESEAQALFAASAAVATDETDPVRWHVDSDRLPAHDEPVSTPEYRPARPRAAIVALVALVLIGIATGVYVSQHPEALERIGLRNASNAIGDAAAPAREPAAASEAPSAAQPPPTPTTTAAPVDVPVVPAAPTSPPPVQAEPTSPQTVPAEPTSPQTVQAEPPPAAAAAASAPPPREASRGSREATRGGASSASRSATSGGGRARSDRSRESRSTARDSRAPPARTQCTPQVAALGLCNP